MIKIKKGFLLGLLMIVLFTSLVSADVEIAEDQIFLNADYSNLRDDNEFITANTDVITLSNSGTEAVTVTVAAEGLPDDYSTDSKEITIPANSSETTSLQFTVPHEEDSGETTVGSIVVKIGDVSQDQVDLIQETKSMLEIREIKIYLNGEREDTLDEDGDKIGNMRPGTELELKFKIRNMFDDDYDNGDIEDVELNVRFADSDDEDDFGAYLDEEPEDDFRELDAGKEVKDDDVVIIIDIPSEADDKTYDLIIELEGKDDENTKHTVEWEIKLEVDRENDDVQLETVELENNVLSCGETTNLDVVMTNFGSNDQDDAALGIYNEALGISENFGDIYLDRDPDDSDNSYSKTISITIDDEVEAGDYYIEVRAFIDDDDQIHYRDVKLTVGECSLDLTDENVEDDDVESDGVDDSGDEEDETTVSGDEVTSNVVKTIENPYTLEDLIMGVLIIGMIIVLGIIFMFLIILIK